MKPTPGKLSRKKHFLSIFGGRKKFVRNRNCRVSDTCYGPMNDLWMINEWSLTDHCPITDWNHNGRTVDQKMIPEVSVSYLWRNFDGSVSWRNTESTDAALLISTEKREHPPWLKLWTYRLIKLKSVIKIYLGSDPAELTTALRKLWDLNWKQDFS